MDLKFEPEKSEVFQIGRVILFWDSLPLLLVRVVAIVGLLFLSFWQSFFAGVLLLFLTFEIFYQFKIKRYESSTTVSKFSEADNVADIFSQKLAKLYLAAGGLPNKLLQLLLAEPESQKFTARIGFAKEKIAQAVDLQTSQNLNISAAFQKSFELAKAGSALQKEKIDTLDLLQSFFETAAPLQKLAFEADVKSQDLDNIAFWVREETQAARGHFIDLDKLASNPGIAQDWISGYTLETQKYTRDITKKFIAGGISTYLVGRKKEIAQIEEILSRDRKKNLILVGEPGVGKSTIVYSLAAACFSGKVAPQLRYKRILELSLADLLAGADLGELERRLAAILAEIEAAADVIFYIPQIENLAGAQTGTEKVDITATLLPTLRGANVQVIGATTQTNYTGYIEGRPAFAEQFEKVVIPQPSTADAVKIAEQAVIKIEKNTRLTFSYRAVTEAVAFSDRYMKDRVLPGKAIDLLDQAAARAVQQRQDVVLPQDIVNLISEKKKIPLDVARGEEKKRLLNLEKILHQRVVDQHQAVTAVAQALRRTRAFVREDKKPVGAFLFLGPTGVGKTETARALANTYFGGEEEIIRLDMSEYQTTNSVERLIGSPGEKGKLTEAIRAKPFSLILLDEMEKANRIVIDLFLQVFDEGRLTDAAGVTVDFTQAIMIATSNAGAEQIRQAILSKKDLQKFKAEFVDYLLKKGIFTPEFLNRFDEVVLFKPLSEDDLAQVAKIQIGQVLAKLAEQEIAVSVSDSLSFWLAKTGYDAVFGARPLRRLIEDKIENFLANKILSAEIVRGDIIFLDHTDGEEIIFEKRGSKFK